MKVFFYSLIFTVFLKVTSLVAIGQMVPMILDTDMGPDYDDVGALAVFHAMADKGELKPLAVIASNKNELVVPSIEIINNYFGRPNLPTGAPKGEAASIGASQGWPQLLVDKFPHKTQKTSDAPDAVTTYRQVLSKQADNSVTIVTIGFLTNMADLMESQPDQISELSGMDLIRKKVKLLVSMAGKFPEGREYNVLTDSLASKQVFDNWPTPILLSGFEIGEKIKTGKKLIQYASADSPVRFVYETAMPHSASDADGRMSWDQTAVLIGARGFNPYFGIKRGKMIVTDGNNAWQDDPLGPHAYIVEQMPLNSIQQLIEALMMWEGAR